MVRIDLIIPLPGKGCLKVALERLRGNRGGENEVAAEQQEREPGEEGGGGCECRAAHREPEQAGREKTKSDLDPEPGDEGSRCEEETEGESAEEKWVELGRELVESGFEEKREEDE